MEPIKIKINDELVEKRIDKFLSDEYKYLSRSYIQTLIDEGNILVNGKSIKPSYIIRSGDVIQMEVPDIVEPDILAEDIPLDIIYEDKDIIIVNKPKGMVVHPSAGHYSGTLVNALMYRFKDELSSINGILRPGIVHRIDMDTTGTLVVCKNDYSHHFISEQLQEHTIARRYNAIVYNSVKDDQGTIDAPIGRHPIDRKKMAINHKNGKSARTHYKVIERFSSRYTHIECSLETGRTHQIRVHMSSINHPLLGDNVYGLIKEKFNLNGQVLHARTLGFIHPTSKEYIEFEAPLPNYFTQLEERLRKVK